MYLFIPQTELGVLTFFVRFSPGWSQDSVCVLNNNVFLNKHEDFFHTSLLILISEFVDPPVLSYFCRDIDIDFLTTFWNMSKRNSKCVSKFFKFLNISIKPMPASNFYIDFIWDTTYNAFGDVGCLLNY